MINCKVLDFWSVYKYRLIRTISVILLLLQVFFIEFVAYWEFIAYVTCLGILVFYSGYRWIQMVLILLPIFILRTYLVNFSLSIYLLPLIIFLIMPLLYRYNWRRTWYITSGIIIFLALTQAYDSDNLLWLMSAIVMLISLFYPKLHLLAWLCFSVFFMLEYGRDPFVALSICSLLLHPNCDPVSRPKEPSSIFYDGDCALCHGVVLFVLSEDRENIFKFSPLKGEFIQSVLSSKQLKLLPDSIVLYKDRKATHYIQSEATVEILKSLGSYWFFFGLLVSIFPQKLRDWGYNFVAKNRRRIFRKYQPKQACPLVPSHQRNKFKA